MPGKSSSAPPSRPDLEVRLRCLEAVAGPNREAPNHVVAMAAHYYEAITGRPWAAPTPQDASP